MPLHSRCKCTVNILKDLSCTCAPHVTRRCGATVGSYKSQTLKGEHLLGLGCFLRVGAV